MDGIKFKSAFWRGVIIGPIAVLPATFFLILMSIARDFTLIAFFEAILKSLVVGFYGVLIAYICMILYGSVVWCFLGSINKLTIASLLIAALVPAFIIVLLSKEYALSLLFAYYSLSVAIAAWFFGLRKMK